MAMAGESVSSRVSPERVNRSQAWKLSQNWLPAMFPPTNQRQKQAPSSQCRADGLAWRGTSNAAQTSGRSAAAAAPGERGASARIRVGAPDSQTAKIGGSPGSGAMGAIGVVHADLTRALQAVAPSFLARAHCLPRKAVVWPVAGDIQGALNRSP